ncbi:MAG: hypothetical protein KJ941_03225 [Bacteroidetes bacterium]|nr:hypothetical protein [Bacteroidota bacterium]
MIEKSKYFEFLQPGPDDNVMERLNDFIWVDENDIICSVPKEEPVKMTMTQINQQIEDWIAIYGEGKKKMLVVINPHVKSTKEERDFSAELLPRFVIAIAVINQSALGRMAINLFLGLKPPSYPLKMFKAQEEAKEWLINIDK